MSWPMEISTSSTSSMGDGDFTLYPSTDLESLHPLDFFPGDGSFTMFNNVPLSHDSAIDSSMDEYFDPEFFSLPQSTARESRILSLNDPLPPTYPNASAGQACIGNYLDPTAFVAGGHNGYPTPPSTMSSPYSPPHHTFAAFPTSTPAPRARRQSSNAPRRRASAAISSPPSSPLPAGASSPTGGKQGVFTCPKCNAIFTFKTNKTRHVNSRACEGKVSSHASTSGDAGAREFPCPIDGCPTVIKRRKDNLAVHLKKIHGLKVVDHARQ